MLVIILSLVSSIPFMYFGVSCLYANSMVREFERYGLSAAQRKLTGVLQIMGSVGLLVGLLVPVIGLVASVGLAVLMILGFITRLKIRDTFLQTLPSFLFLMLNAFLAYVFLTLVF